MTQQTAVPPAAIQPDIPGQTRPGRACPAGLAGTAVVTAAAATEVQAGAAGPPGLPPAAVADGIVYAGGNDYVVHALRVGNGRPVWAFTADGPVESQIAAAGRAAYVGSNGGQVYALTR